mmetsp:Transcript_26049/g.67111  ORF Transcript_26049/g.67111 Transcript_26049/m.67111 type:complete len:234 (+) Transcript_26049:521-1222(+)
MLSWVSLPSMVSSPALDRTPLGLQTSSSDMRSAQETEGAGNVSQQLAESSFMAATVGDVSRFSGSAELKLAVVASESSSTTTEQFVSDVCSDTLRVFPSYSSTAGGAPVDAFLRRATSSSAEATVQCPSIQTSWGDRPRTSGQDSMKWDVRPNVLLISGVQHSLPPRSQTRSRPPASCRMESICVSACADKVQYPSGLAISPSDPRLNPLPPPGPSGHRKAPDRRMTTPRHRR